MWIHAAGNLVFDTYVEMATRTAVGRAAVEGHVNRLVGRGFSLVMVSDAPQECELCRPFEGKVFSIGDGVAPEGVTVLMPLDEARARGLVPLLIAGTSRAFTSPA